MTSNETRRSLLAYAIAIESCIDNLCNEEDEHIALLCLRRLLDATGAGTGTADLSVLSLRLEIDSRLEGNILSKQGPVFIRRRWVRSAFYHSQKVPMGLKPGGSGGFYEAVDRGPALFYG